ncbi:hypothetical protein H0X10_00750 [Candidatus Saccharibacteria bacterium]|nr:hypothetical protein [Candidatus Saccharibacteria bacterium]
MWLYRAMGDNHEMALGPTSFVCMPLEFFGQDITFLETDEYKTELQLAELETERGIADLLISETAGEERDSLIAYEQRRHRENVVNKWYDMRMRGRYSIPEDISSRHETARAALSFNSEAELPPTEEIASFLNEVLTSQRWMHAYDFATKWHKRLREDDPNLAVAANYAGYAGGAILYQYARKALAMSGQALAEDDFLRVKHLITICWPVCEELRQYAPDEAAKKRQLLRELFLECASQSPDTVARYTDMLWTQEELADRSITRDERNQAALNRLLKFEDTSPQVRNHVLNVLEDKISAHHQKRMPLRSLDTIWLAGIATELDVEFVTKLGSHVAQFALQTEAARIRQMGDEAHAQVWDEDLGISLPGSGFMVDEICYHRLFDDDKSNQLLKYFDELLHESTGEQLELF